MARIDRYNKAASAPKNKSNEIIDIIGIGAGDKVLEIGVGGGYYAEKFSTIIGTKGSYYGIDIDKEFIENLNILGKTNLNIAGIIVQPNEVPHFKDKIDYVFTRIAYHHLENRVDYFRKISDIMAPKGKVVIIDYDESFSLMRLFGHYTKKALIVHELTEAGFSLIKDLKLLSKQSFLIFEK